MTSSCDGEHGDTPKKKGGQSLTGFVLNDRDRGTFRHLSCSIPEAVLRRERVRDQWVANVNFVRRSTNLGDNSVGVNEKDDLADAASSAVLRPGLPTLATLFPRLFDGA